MFWLDSVLAVPALGIQVTIDLKSIDLFRTKIHAFLNSLSQDNKELEVKPVDIWGYSVAAKSGFSFTLTPKNIVSTFSYRLTQRSTGGGLPILEKPDIKPYSEIFQLTLAHMKNIVGQLGNIQDMTCNRIGVVADLNVDETSLPPGLSKYLEHLTKPWCRKLVAVNSSLLVNLSDEKANHDQCHHAVEFNVENPERGYRFKLDWQRVYKDRLSFKDKIILEKIDACKNEAFAYFRKFGEGDLNYV